MARFQDGVAFMVLLVSLAMTTPHVTKAITCDKVTTLLTPCIPYGVLGVIVPPDCCAGIKGLNAAQKNKKEDRISACSCIQKGAADIPGINYDRINMLGDLCGSHCPYKVYPSTDCAQVS